VDQALRGSSELRAWADSNLYLRRIGIADQPSLVIDPTSSAKRLCAFV